MLPAPVEEKLQETEKRLAEVQEQLADPELFSEPSRLRLLSRECGSLAKVVDQYRRYRELLETIADNREISENAEEEAELRELALEEIEQLSPELELTEQELMDRILVEDKDGGRNVIVEIRAGAGGDEAALHSPQVVLVLEHLPSRKGFAVE